MTPPRVCGFRCCMLSFATHPTPGFINRSPPSVVSINDTGCCLPPAIALSNKKSGELFLVFFFLFLFLPRGYPAIGRPVALPNNKNKTPPAHPIYIAFIETSWLCAVPGTRFDPVYGIICGIIPSFRILCCFTQPGPTHTLGITTPKTDKAGPPRKENTDRDNTHTPHTAIYCTAFAFIVQ